MAGVREEGTGGKDRNAKDYVWAPVRLEAISKMFFRETRA
jgi:hypothetical protein